MDYGWQNLEPADVTPLWSLLHPTRIVRNALPPSDQQHASCPVSVRHDDLIAVTLDTSAIPGCGEKLCNLFLYGPRWLDLGM
jgi:hypothetical protein